MKRLIKKASYTMYHCTNYYSAIKILEDGFIKTGSEVGDSLDNTIQTDVVYLSDNMHGDEFGDIFFEIEIDNNAELRADDDCINPDYFQKEFVRLCYWNDVYFEPKLQSMDPEEFRNEIANYRDKEDYRAIILEVMEEAIEDGETSMESVAHIGSIPVSQIKTMYVGNEETDIITVEELERLADEEGLSY